MLYVRLASIATMVWWDHHLDNLGLRRRDITFLIINKQTGLPGQIGFELAKPPSLDKRRMADDMIYVQDCRV